MSPGAKVSKLEGAVLYLRMKQALLWLDQMAAEDDLRYGSLMCYWPKELRAAWERGENPPGTEHMRRRG